MSGRVRVESPLRTSQDQAKGGAQGRAEPPTHGPPDALPLRELTGWEEEFLERRQHEPNTARTCNEVLAMCCVPPGSDPDEAVRDRVRALLVAERDCELVRLRRMSIGPDVEATVGCPACGGTIEASFSLDTLDLDVEVPQRRTGIPLDDPDGLTLDLPTAGDQEELLDAGVDSPAERRTWLLGQCLKDTEGIRLGPEAARALPMSRRAELEGAVDERVPDLDLDMGVTCVHCGAEFSSPFDVAVFFFSS